MADSTFDIRVRALVEGLANVTKLVTELTATGQQATVSGDRARDAGGRFVKLSDGANTAASSVKNLTGSMEPLGAGIDRVVGLVKQAAAAFIAFTAVFSLKDSADTAARVETLGVTLDIVGKNAGYSKTQISAYVSETKALGITTESAQNSVLQFIQAGLQLEPVLAGGASGVGKLARAAQDFAVVTGQNSSETLSRLITNIQQLDVEGLRFVGIVVDQTAAQDKFATAANKSVGALSTQERQQALYNEVLSKSAAYTGAYEASLETTGKKLSSLSRLQTEAGLAIGDKLLPAYNAIVVVTSNFLGWLEKTVKGLDESGQAAKGFGDAIKNGLEFVGEIGKTIFAAIQPIFPALENLKNKFSDAFAGESLRGFLPVLQKVWDAIVGLAVAMINAYAQAAPAIKGVFDQVVAIAKSFYEFAAAVIVGATALQGVSNEGKILKTTLETIGLILAGIRDGFSILGATFELVGGVILRVAASTVEGWSKVAFLFPSISKSLKEVAAALREQSDAAIDGGKKTFEAFARGESAVAKYGESLKAIPSAAEDAAAKAIAAQNKANAAYLEADAIINKLAADQRKGLKGEDFAKALQAATAEVTKLSVEGGIAQKSVDQLAARLNSLKDKDDEVAKAFKLLNVSVQEFKTGVDQAGATALGAFNAIAQSGEVTGKKLYDAFKLALDFNKSLEGLKGFGQALKDTFDKKRIGLDEFQSGVAQLSLKFDELFDKQLKAARTKTDFDELRKKVQDLGAAGTISGTQMNAALTGISEKASGAREQLGRLSEQATALAEAGTAVARADLDMTKAALAVQTAKAKVVEAENKFKADGSELSKAELAAARAQFDLAEQQLERSRKQRAEEVAALDLLTAKQKQLNAEKAVALNPNDGAAKAALDAANKEVEAKQRVVDATKQEVAEQQAVVTAAEAAVAVANQMVDSLDKAAASAKKTISIFESAKYNKEGLLLGADGAVFEAVSHTLEGITAALQQLGLSYEDASAKAREFIDYQHSIQPAAGVAKISAAIAQIADELRINRAEADAVNRAYAYAKDLIDRMASGTLDVGQNSEYVALAVQQSGQQMRDLAAAAGDAGAAVRAIRADAQSVAQAARDAASAFVGSAANIHEELLSATGQEEEASAARFETRKRELQTEYELLKVKIQIAIATAKAAGVSTDGLDQSLIDADLAQARALKDLADLEALEKQKIVARKAEEQRQRQAAADKDAQEAKDADARRAASDAAAHDQRVRNERDLQALRRQGESDLLNRAAPSTPLGDRLLRQVNQANNFGTPISSSASQAAADRSPSRVVQINFTNDQGASIPVTVAEDYIEPLLAMLQRAKKASI